MEAKKLFFGDKKVMKNIKKRLFFINCLLGFKLGSLPQLQLQQGLDSTIHPCCS